MNYIFYKKRYKDEDGIIQEKEIELPVIVNFSALKKFTNKTNVPYVEFERIINDLNLIEHLFWYSLEAGCKEEFISNPLKRDEAEDILNKHYSEFLKIYMENVVNLLTPTTEDNKEEIKEEIEQKKS